MLTSKQLFKLRMETSRMFPYNIVRVCLVLPIRQNVNNPGIVTLGRDFIGFSEEYSELEYPVMKDVLAHSILYYQFNHYKRSKGFVTDSISKIIWNIASEVCRSSFLNRYINTHYREQYKKTLVVNGCEFAYPEALGLPDGLSVEQYYELLYEKYMNNKAVIEDYKTGGQIEYSTEPEENTEPGAAGGKAGGALETGEALGAQETGEYEDPVPPEDMDGSIGNFDTESQIQIESAQAIKNALSTLSRGFNSLHGELQQFSESPEARDRRKIARLRKLLNTCIHGGPGKHMTGPRPRRRAPGEIKIMEDVKVGFKPVAVVVDVSGSTEGFREQIYDVLALTIRATHLIDVYIGDVTVLMKRKNIRRPNQISSMPGGGGTDMGAIMKELDKLGKYHTIIVITDGLTPWPEQPLNAKSFVCLLGEAYGAEVSVPDWIRLI